MTKDERVQHEVDAILGEKTEDGFRAVPVYEHEDGSVRSYSPGDDLDEYIRSVTESGNDDE